VTGFKGKTATYESTSTRTGNGFTRQAEATGPKGGEAQKQVTVTRENGVVTRSATTTTSPPSLKGTCTFGFSMIPRSPCRERGDTLFPNRQRV
jgi:hypothetical protein